MGRPRDEASPGLPRRLALAGAVAALALALAAPASPQGARPAAGDDFSFYGLRFGMFEDEVRAVRPTNAAGTEVLDPGHGMTALVLAYDYLGRLSEIRASYARPADRLRESALRQALRERFIQPIATGWPEVSAELDEYFNRAAITLVLVSSDLRREALEHFRDEYLREME